MRQKMVVGNWKMHGSLSVNADLIAALQLGCSKLEPELLVVVCAPFPYLPQIQSLLSDGRVCLGAQNVSEYSQGAHTGDVSASMLLEFGCRYVIVGHSERRLAGGEVDAQIAKKAHAALGGGISPIICVGETLAERLAEKSIEVVSRQLKVVLDVIGVTGLAKSVLAYEPVWAIGTGCTATTSQIAEVHAALRGFVADYDQELAQGLKILYGGSVKAGNAADIFAVSDVDGGLIGGASLVPDEFLAICSSVRVR